MHKKNDLPCAYAEAFTSRHIEYLVIAIEIKGDSIVSRPIFDALSIGEGLVAAVLLWAAQFYHKVR